MVLYIQAFYTYFVCVCVCVRAWKIYVIHYLSSYRIPLFRLTSLIESLRANHDPAVLADRAPAGPTAHIHSGILQVRVSKFCGILGLKTFVTTIVTYVSFLNYRPVILMIHQD